MGRQTNIKLKLTSSDVIYYESRGKYYMRSKPKKVKQTPATQNRSKQFGLAAKLEKIFRNLFLPAIPFHLDLAAQRRFRTAIYRYLNEKTDINNWRLADQCLIKRFEFNLDSLLACRFKVPVQIVSLDNDKLLLQIPSFLPALSVTAPAYTESVIMNIIAAVCSPDNLLYQNSYRTQIVFPFNNIAIPAQRFEIPLQVLPGGMVLVLGSLQYRINKENSIKMNSDMRWLPAGVLTAL